MNRMKLIVLMDILFIALLLEELLEAYVYVVKAETTIIPIMVMSLPFILSDCDAIIS